MKYKLAASQTGWDILEHYTRGEDSKTPGAEGWRAIKFFATLEQAATRLLDLLAREGVTPDSGTQEIIDAVLSATAMVVQAVKAANHD